MLKTVSVVVLALAGTTANAATILYNVNQTIGLGGVVGTIETNGTFGTLTQADIVGFDLVVSAPGAAVELTDANSVIVTQGSNFTADAASLFFDYSGAAPGFLLFQLGSFGTGMKYYCNSSVSDTCFQGASAVPESFDSPSVQVEPRAGNQVIASVAAAVPEPASWAMMLGGFLVVGAAMRRTSRPLAA